MPRLTEASRLSRRHEIAEAAMRCIVRLGFAHTTMADVIAESGLSAGSIYSHFAGKNELVRFAFTTVVASREAALEALIAARGGSLSPSEVVTDVLSGIDTEKDSKAFLHIWAASMTDPEIAETITANLDELVHVMTRAITAWARSRSEDQVAAERLAYETSKAAIALMQGYVVQVALDSPPELQSFLRLIEGAFGDERSTGRSSSY